MKNRPGLVVLFGSGETSASGRKVYDRLFRRLSQPIQVSILETPAGFEPNSAQVAGKVADFIRQRLQNYHPKVTVVPARKKGTPYSPDDPGIIAPLLQSNVIFLGPGSPTYAVRQLQDSLAWHTLRARHRWGAALILASAATVAIGAHALPVYEIYKVGADLHWQPGLDFFGPYGLSLVFVPHWNNREGGADLDTSHCFMGQTRFTQLQAMLPDNTTLVGINEHTALAIDPGAETCHVMGAGNVTVLRQGIEQVFAHEKSFPLAELGTFLQPKIEEGIPPAVWKTVRTARPPDQNAQGPSSEIIALVEQRETARARRDWAQADSLRDTIAARGWQIMDTPSGPELEEA